jgi:hypothetical protein
MKKYVLFIVVSFFLSSLLNAQVGIGTTNPDNSALLDLSSTSSGILIPRMTETEKNDIVSPVNGLLIFQTNESAGFHYYDEIQSLWIPINKKYKIGDFAQGGIVFWVDETGEHGLVCTTTNQGSFMTWSDGNNTVTNAIYDGVFAGQINTQLIIQSLGSGAYPAKLCDDLVIISNNVAYHDWYLPSLYELRLMHNNIGNGNTLGLGNVGTFILDYYWSSNEINDNSAWKLHFSGGGDIFSYKAWLGYVRAVRAF